MPNPFEIFDPRFENILPSTANLEQLATGCLWSEGPAYFAHNDSLLWSDIPNNRLMQWSAQHGSQECLKPAHFQNGHTLDLQGRLLACSHGQRAVLRREHDGIWTVLVDSHQGKKLNSPNDVVVKSDGTVWFSDPDYGLIQPNEGYGGIQEQPGCFVYRFDPVTRETSVVVADMQKPNGLAFSPDEQTLYISDTSRTHDPAGHHHIRAYDVVDGRRCEHGRVFASITPGLPDGLRLDTQGWVFTSAGNGVQVFAPTGEHLGTILVPEPVGNLTFGGPNKNRLFVVATSSLYAMDLNTQGCT